MKENYAFVIMIKEKWWREFLRLHHEGKQIQSYVQGGWAPPKNTSIIIFYVTKPLAKISGYAESVERKVGEPEEMWKTHGNESVLSSAEQYFDFVKGKERVSFIRFKNLHEATQSIPLNNVLAILGVKRLARKGFYVDKETADKLIELMA
jgi:predicted transcriptional regulator